MYYLEHPQGDHKRMRNAVLVAAALHVLLALGVSFDNQSNPRQNSQIEVTLATRPSQAAPEEARHVAQSNQEGGGEMSDINAVTSQNNELPMQSKMPQRSAPQQAEIAASSSGQLLSTVAAAPRAVSEDQREDTPAQNLMPGMDPEVER
ncbi:MAG: hypothetical protein V2I38_09370, partial [Alcanivoracaceae bacterium]|nr:hypothetical protein [Alcanivoracaceae bacterium]